MPNLYGTHHGSADEKGRVMLPVELKNQYGAAVKKAFFIKQSIFHKALEMFTEKAWIEYSKDTDEVDTFSKEGTNFLLMFNAGVRQVFLDSNGRFNIPVELFEFAGIKKEVVMTAMKDRVLIWDHKAFEKFMSDNRPHFEKTTENVMGPIKRSKKDGK
ncbi:MAG TPA: division/cell wall cluster transcriptional repressor MraZ [Bacteroidia bacterium]|nr:division/cell wall cluster transcriptional repressor MraZ [Bacteroidia bacterium]